MSSIESSPTIENILLGFEVLCENFEGIIEEYNINTTIEKTKLGFYRRKIKEWDYKIPNDESLKLFNIINKLISLNILFDPSINVDLDYKNLLNILKGSNSFDDADEGYNDTFFELDMAIRFIIKASELGLADNFLINLNTDCDIIIGGKTAIECKYIHSRKRLIEHINKAIKQIDNRIAEGLAERGIIAIDLSHIMDKYKFDKIAQEVFTEFYSISEKLSTRSFMSDAIGNNILISTIENTNFRNILQSYYITYLEEAFYESLNQSTKDKIKNNLKIKAIIFQSRNLIIFKSPTGTSPVMNRGMTYYLNENLPEEEKNNLKGIIASLAVGI